MDGAAPLVSVVIATYNWSSVLRLALLSVQSQRLADFEVLVIGDGCTDDSGEVVASFGDPRFRWENLPANHGHQSAANNRGLEMARGKWIAYLGHDDLWMPNHLELLVRELESTGADIAFSLGVLIGAPELGGRRLFGAFENGRFPRGAHIPPSGLVHRKSLVDQSGGWPDHRVTRGSPEADLCARFLDQGAKFVGVSEVTVFKFPSAWRPYSYTTRSCEEQTAFFARMQNEPDFLHRELIELAVAQELVKPHTKVSPESPQAHFLPGALIENCRRNRGLESDPPEQGAPRYIPSPAMLRLIDEEVRRRQTTSLAVFELFYPRDGGYDTSRRTTTLVPTGKWTRVRVALEHPCDGGPLRIDPADFPGTIEVASIALRRGGKIQWQARGSDFERLTAGGDAFVVRIARTLTLESRGNDPMLFLGSDAPAQPPSVLDCWLRVTRPFPTS